MTTRSTLRSTVMRAFSVTAVTALFTGMFVAAGTSASLAEEGPLTGGTLVGIVTDSADSSPISDVTVAIVGPGGSLSQPTAEGEFEFPGLIAGSYTITLSDASEAYFAPEPVVVEVVGGEVTTQNFALNAQPNYTLSGMITVNGVGVSGINVSVEDMENSQFFSGVSDPDGRYLITGIDGAFARVYINDAAYLPVQSDSIPLGPGGATFDIALEELPPATGRVSGVVRDRSTGAVIPGAEVRLTIPDVFGFDRSTTADSLGFYEFTNVLLTTVSISASSYPEPGEEGPQYPPVLPVNVMLSADQQERQRDIRLTAVPVGDAELTVCVTTAESLPVADLFLGLGSVFTAVMTPTVAFATTGADGCGTMTGVVPGEYRIGFTDPRYLEPTIQERLVTVGAEPTTKNLVVTSVPQGTGRIEGIVRENNIVDGAPIAGASVMITSLNSFPYSAFVTTASDGTWVLEEIPAGRYELLVSDMGIRYELPLTGRAVTVTDGETLDVADALNAVVAGTGSLSGRVRDSVTHLPVAGAEVILSREAQGYPIDPVTTDATGAYRFDDLPDGFYTIDVAALGFTGVFTGIQIEDGSAEVLNVGLVAQPELAVGTGTIRGVVVDENDDPLDQVFIMARSARGGGGAGTAVATTNADGVFEITELPLTNWELEFNASYSGDYGPVERTVVLTAGDPDEDLRVQILPAGAITGTLDLSGIPAGSLSAVEVVALDAETGTETRGAPEIVGDRFRIGGLAPGEYVVAVRANPGMASVPDFGIAPRFWSEAAAGGVDSLGDATVVDVVSGQTRSGLAFAITEGAIVSGQAFVGAPGGLTGLPLMKSINVEVYRLVDGEWLRQPLLQTFISFQSADRFLLPGLSPGQYRLEFSDFFQGSRSLATTYSGDVTEFEQAEIITVEAGARLTDVDVIMSMRRPDSAPSTVLLDDLGDDANSLQGQIDVPEEVTEGDDVTVQVGRELAGEWVSVWANSTPTRIGDWVQVSAAGTVTVALPANLVGEHRIAVQDADEAVFGWDTVTVVENGEEPGGGDTPGGGGSGEPPATGGPGATPGTPAAPSTPSTRPGTRTSGTPAESVPALPPAPAEEAPEETTAEEAPSQPTPEAAQSEPLAAGDDAGQPLWLWLTIGGLVLAALIAAGVILLRRRTA